MCGFKCGIQINLRDAVRRPLPHPCPQATSMSPYADRAVTGLE